MRNEIKLFEHYQFSKFEDDVLRQACSCASSLEADHFSRNSIESLAEQIVDSFLVSKLVFKEESARIVNHRERVVSVFDGFGSHVQAKGIEFAVEWEIDGDDRLWEFEPGRGPLSRPQYLVQVQNGHLTYTAVHAFSELQDGMDSKIAEFSRHISGRVNDINVDVDRLNSLLYPAVINALTIRLSEVKKIQKLLSSTRFPIVSRSTPAVSVPLNRKVLNVSPKPGSSGTISSEAEPFLDGKEYQTIIGVANQVCLAMERSPSAFRLMREDQIRDVFLIFLNGYFEGRAGGETFNNAGKTDILINVGGKNVFIAECKFWGGKALFSETIDQIMSYLGWRDTKAALLIFNKNKDVTNSIREARDCLLGREDHIRETLYLESELKIENVLCRSDDRHQRVFLTTMMFSIPTK